MGQMQIRQKNESGNLKIEVEGQIDEDANFSGHELTSQKIILDLEAVEGINSCGIREWIKWIKTAPENSQIIYQKCPKVIVDQINMVAGFLPSNGDVESFYVPYYCEDSGGEKMILFTKGKEFSGSEIRPPENILCEDSGEEMEMDVIEAKYFKFLRG